MMKSSSKVSQLIKDDIQSKIIQIYKSVDPEINTFYYTRKINELIKDFNKNVKLGKKEDICSEKTILLISYADNLKIKGEKNTLNIFNTFLKKGLNKILTVFISFHFSHRAAIVVSQLKIIMSSIKGSVTGITLKDCQKMQI